jgi:hypothetical protein
VARALIDIGSLDLRMQEQIATHGSLKDFQLALWRQEPDETGCNWNARIDRVAGAPPHNCAWHGVVPQLRARYNLN